MKSDSSITSSGATVAASTPQDDSPTEHAHTFATRLMELRRLTSLPLGDDPVDALRTFADALPQLVWITDSDGKVSYCNAQWWKYTGLTYEQSIGDGWTILLHPEDLDRTLARWNHACQTGEPYEIEYRLRRASDGEYRWFIGRGLPFRSPSGQILAWFGTCTDIHDQKVAQELLEQAQKQLEQTAKAKDEFLAVLSHELRTPLSAILGWVQLLRMNALNPTEQSEALATIEEQAKVQSQLVEDLLEVSRIISGKFRMRDESVDLHRVVMAAIEAIRPAASNKQIPLKFEPIDQSLQVRGDAQRLQQVVWNLLTNAVKFTPEGGQIVVSLDRQGSLARLKVVDTGCGIEPFMLERIFNRFEQADSSASRSHAGLGLGLSIVKHIVDLHQGTITAESRGKNLGSTFTVLLPIQAICFDHNPDQPELSIDHKTALTGRRLLVVDDDLHTRIMLQAVLRTFGAEVVLAESAAEAIHKLQDQTFDALLSDLAMPGKNGLELIRQVRQNAGRLSTLPAIALTAYSSVDDQAAALQAGFDRHVSKPVQPLTLLKTIVNLLGHGASVLNS